jgi:hypothetical protein
MINSTLKTLTEMMFIIFLFYSNLLMGQYTHDKLDHHVKLLQAAENIFSLENFAIAVVCAFIGHILFDRIRRRL